MKKLKSFLVVIALILFIFVTGFNAWQIVQQTVLKNAQESGVLQELAKRQSGIEQKLNGMDSKNGKI